MLVGSSSSRERGGGGRGEGNDGEKRRYGCKRRTAEEHEWSGCKWEILNLSALDVGGLERNRRKRGRKSKILQGEECHNFMLIS